MATIGQILLNMADDGEWNSTALDLIVILVAFGFCYSWWRHVGSGRRRDCQGQGRGFDVKPTTDDAAPADPGEDSERR